MKKYGFYCRMYGKDCFIETDQTRRTRKLAEDFILTIQFKLNKPCCANDENIKYVQNSMQYATYEIKTIKNGKFKGLKYYIINGENFSLNSDACEDVTDFCILI